jgi:hypothetical protein
MWNSGRRVRNEYAPFIIGDVVLFGLPTNPRTVPACIAAVRRRASLIPARRRRVHGLRSGARTTTRSRRGERSNQTSGGGGRSDLDPPGPCTRRDDFGEQV